MTRDEVLALKPGDEMDVKIAELVYGWQWRRSRNSGRRCIYAPGKEPSWMKALATGEEKLVTDWKIGLFVPPYSTLDGAALAVLYDFVPEYQIQIDSQGLHSDGKSWERYEKPWYVLIQKGASEIAPLFTAWGEAQEDTLALAICRAALLVKAEEAILQAPMPVEQ